jgi:hypothetical protein
MRNFSLFKLVKYKRETINKRVKNIEKYIYEYCVLCMNLKNIFINGSVSLWLLVVIGIVVCSCL